jgi:methylated-DNA-[protein]-cysteine S-methyltransferase
MRLAYHVMSSPVGLLFLARSERGLRYLEFMDRKSIKRMIARHGDALPDAVWEPSLFELKPAVEQLEGYFCGALDRFDLPLDAVGSPFQLEVWRALLEIPYGETRSYGQIAKAIGQPRSARAVGLANNQNPIAIVVPCHRVIGANGALTGYGGGLGRKKWLLQLESKFKGRVDGSGDLFSIASGRSGAKRESR